MLGDTSGGSAGGWPGVGGSRPLCRAECRPSEGCCLWVGTARALACGPGVKVRVEDGGQDWAGLGCDSWPMLMVGLGLGPAVYFAVDVWVADAGFALDLKNVTLDLRWICAFSRHGSRQ